VGRVLGTGFGAALAAARAGDDAGFDALWTDAQPALLRYLTVAAGPAAEDVASETWLRVAEDLGRFDGEEANFRAWLFTIARHRVLDWRRRERRTRTVAVPAESLTGRAAADDPARDALDRCDTDRALALIAALPADEAEVVLLGAVGGLDVRDVARVVGRRPSATRALIRHGLQQLAVLLGDDRDRDGPAAGVTAP